MQIKFLAKAKADLRWFKQYYVQVFPAGQTKANQQYAGLLILLKSQPGAGHPAEDLPDVLEYVLPGIPFTVLYRIKGDTIEIMRLYDQRSEFSNQRGR
ncbi:type II toxin-antitoxin system RelE/ParE family toxin [uncultured Kiloniella sp.]|uniref:type II toxin-antitoxin system RelE/ParE family toxin n=1 Tax=uncultured Kiloniella sp. TaxID=1133091 RepID=UPI0026107301|nr:type II toxin-antitoxin system RelE/ParE family toxin [uncultured Kiloniella sp.]